MRTPPLFIALLTAALSVIACGSPTQPPSPAALAAGASAVAAGGMAGGSGGSAASSGGGLGATQGDGGHSGTPTSGGSASDGGSGDATSGGAAGSSGVAGSGETAGGGASSGGAGSSGAAGLGGAAGAGGSPPSGGGAGRVDPATLPDITLFLAGDSTVMAYGEASAQQGWGEHLDEFFLAKVRVNNQALGGRSVKSFTTDRWPNIKSAMRAGDYVMIEFGINDSSAGSDRFVAIPEFKTLLGAMVDDVQAARAVPILVTPTALQEWRNGTEGNARLGPYATAMKEVAATNGILVADLNARSVEYLNEIGQSAAAGVYFMGDKAHFTLHGATEMARLLTEELARIQSPLAGYVR